MRVLMVVVAAALLSGCGMAKMPPNAAARAELHAVREAGIPNEQRKMVRNAWMALETKREKDVAPALEKAKAMTLAMGGYVSSEREGAATLRVPNERLDEALDALGKLAEVADKQVMADDVTSAYYDLQLRIENGRSMSERLRALLEQAQNVEEMLAVEKELSRVTLELEQLEAQMRRMEANTTLATIHLEVRKRVIPGPVGWVFYGLYRGTKWLIVWD